MIYVLWLLVIDSFWDALIPLLKTGDLVNMDYIIQAKGSMR